LHIYQKILTIYSPCKVCVSVIQEGNLLASDVREEIFGIVDQNLSGIQHPGLMWSVVAIFTDRRVMVIDSGKYKKWLDKNGGTLRKEMLEDLSKTLLHGWTRAGFEIYRKDIREIKAKPKRRILLLPRPAMLEIKPKSRIRHLGIFEILIQDNLEVDKLNNIIKSLPDLIN
jgi:hypothetical protein